MTYKRDKGFLSQNCAPHPLDFPIKDPFRETYRGRWSQVPILHKVYVVIVLGFWCLFISVMVWNKGRPQYLTVLVEVVFVATTLGTFFLCFGDIFDNIEGPNTKSTPEGVLLYINETSLNRGQLRLWNCRSCCDSCLEFFFLLPQLFNLHAVNLLG